MRILFLIGIGILSLLVATGLCAVGFLLEVSAHGDNVDQEQRDFFMARAGFSCSMHLEPMAELLLLQLPFVLGGVFLFVQIIAIIRHILAGMTQFSYTRTHYLPLDQCVIYSP